MHYIENFLLFIEKNKLIDRNDSILILFSGGPDSVFLCEMLCKISVNYKLRLGIFHLNHMLRGVNSDNDEKFSINYAQKKNLEIFTEKYDIKKFSTENKMSLEEAGRILRYNIAKEIADRNNFNKIATAHHFDDQIETFFLNIFRGKGLRSLESIRLKHKNIIRPILNFKKDDILLYLEENKINFVIDKSNYNKEFLRNKIRLELIPFITEKFSEDFKNNIYNLTLQTKSLNQFIEKEVSNYIKILLKKEGNGYRIDIFNLPENDFIFIEVLKKILEMHECYNYNRNVLINLSNFIKNYNGVYIFKNLKFYKEYSSVFIEKLNEYNPEYKLLITPVTKKINFLKKPKSIEFIDKDKVKFPLTIRFFQNGDRFQPLGFKSETKLKDFFINQKIPVRIRRKIPLVVDNNNTIIWIVGYRISEKVKLTSETRNILKLEIKKF